jgi:hypothetical protein
MFIALGPNKTILLHRNEYVVQLERFIQTWHNELHNQKTARSRVLSPRVPRSNNSGLQYGVRSTEYTELYGVPSSPLLLQGTRLSRFCQRRIRRKRAIAPLSYQSIRSVEEVRILRSDSHPSRIWDANVTKADCGGYSSAPSLLHAVITPL